MSTDELRDRLIDRYKDFQDALDRFEKLPLSEAEIEKLMQSWQDVHETMVVLKFLVGVPEDSSFLVERNNDAHEETNEPLIQDDEPTEEEEMLHQVEEFEESIAEDVQVEEDMPSEAEVEPEVNAEEQESVVVPEPEPVKENQPEEVEEPVAEEKMEEPVAEVQEEEKQVEPIVDDTPVEDPVQEAEASREINDAHKPIADFSLAGKLKKSPISDLKAAIGLNQRFLFSNELFNGNMEAFNRALNELNHLESIDDAQRYIEAQLAPSYQWNGESETVLEFVELVHRRFM